MKSISVELDAHLSGGVQTIVTCWMVTLTNGTVKTFTDHDQDIVFGGRTYLAASGYNASDIASSSDLNPDNLELIGLLNSPSITEEDLLAGVWDYAQCRIFIVNWADLTMLSGSERAGTIGEVTLERVGFKAEFRGKMQRYARTIGFVEGPSCTANLGDSRCTKDLSTFTRIGTITGVHDDGLTLYDTASNEDGPSGGVVITGITNANPGVVTTATAHGFTEGQAITLADIVGPSSLNAVTIVRNPGTTTFELGVDTSDTADYPAYVSGGTATPLGGDAGYFDDGVLTFTSGANDGFSREIKGYVPGQFSLQLKFPYAVEVGDTYTATPGCDKSLETCRDRFNNVVNMRAFPYLPGTDKIVQVGRRN